MRIKYILLFLFIPCTLCAQDIETWVASQKTILYEKVYLHVDREFYSPGDNIWFKTYLVSGINHRLLQGYKNIYVQLVSGEGKVLAARILLSRDGTSHGDIMITDSIPDGQYTLRAYTKYLENFGEESCFHKRIWVSRARNSLEVGKVLPEEGSPVDVAFFPESGDLVMNCLNYVAVKAVDRSGRGVSIRGTIVDGNNTVVTSFQTGFHGMGKLMLMPLEDKTYTARITGHPELTCRLGNIREDGLALNCRDAGEEEVLFTVSRNIKKSEQQEVYLVASHKGIVLFYKKIILDGFTRAFKVGKNLFPPGISKITLLGMDFHELAERLIFIRDGGPPLAQLSLNKEEFTTRDKAKVDICLSLDQDDTLRSTLSVAVVNKDYFTAGGNTLTITSYLLLDSELKGIIESPASYFTDSDGLTSPEKLDLLMMVQGWRSYYWNDITAFPQEKLAGWNDAGITVEGSVKALLRKRPVVGGEVVLGPFSRNLLFEETRTDSLGRFRFDRLYLKDSALIMINAKNERDRPNTEIIPDSVVLFPPSVSSSEIQSSVGNITLPLKFFRENYYRQLRLQEFNPERDYILLNEIEVLGRHQEKDDGHFRLYTDPDQVLQITDEDFAYLDILDYLQSKVAGLVITGETISMRGGGMPLFLLDGIKVDPDMVGNLIFRIPMGDVDKIEILKSGANMAIFGSQGGNGVIAVYTKRGDVDREIERYVKGRIIFRVNGFRTPAQFYSPKYSLENIGNPQPDYRPTLYWDPIVGVENGKAEIEFYTSDELADYALFVEGITRKGRICFATGEFRVTSVHRDN